MRRKTNAVTERKVGRTDPPLFMFQPLRTAIMGSLETTAGLGSKILSIVAPVGYGKTVLMSMLFSDLHRMGKQCLWLALDDRDTTAEGVISVLGSLLNHHESELHPTQAIFRGNQPIDTRIEALIDLIDRYPLPITLFIDNINCCTDDALGRLLDALVFDTKPTVQLVLSSTQEIPLDTSRAVLEGLIRQLSHAELSFNVAEVGGLLGNDVCTRIGTHGIEELEQLVDSGTMEAAFHLQPVSFEELKAVADSGGTMPPKSTYIEPKLRSGLTVYSLEDV